MSNGNVSTATMVDKETRLQMISSRKKNLFKVEIYRKIGNIGQ